MSVTVTSDICSWHRSFPITCKAANRFFDEPHSGPYKNEDTINFNDEEGCDDEFLIHVNNLINKVDIIYDKLVLDISVWISNLRYCEDYENVKRDQLDSIVNTVQTITIPNIIEYYNGADFDVTIFCGEDLERVVEYIHRETRSCLASADLSEYFRSLNFIAKICSPRVHFLFKMAAKTGEDVVKILEHIGDNGCYRWIDCIDHTFDEWDWFKEIYKDNTSLTPDFFKYLLTLKYPRLNEKKPMKKVKRKRVVDEDND